METPQSREPHIPVIKRIFDLVVAISILIVISPILLIVALMVWVVHGRPIIFSQPRPGFKGKIFTIHKFRTMTEARDSRGKPLPDTVRLTGFGKFLRSFSLDEWPELINVIKGEMSLVGPRPLLVEYLNYYTPEQHRRHDMLPGITGWAQVNGRNALSWEEKFKLDVWYVDHWSFWLDLKILWLTIWYVIKRQNVTPPGQTSMGEFKGSSSEIRK